MEAPRLRKYKLHSTSNTPYGEVTGTGHDQEGKHGPRDEPAERRVRHLLRLAAPGVLGLAHGEKERDSGHVDRALPNRKMV